MMRNTILLLLLIFSFSACNDDDTVFETGTEGLEVKFTPVAGGAMMHYTLPNNRDIFAMNVRYKDWQGNNVLKTCGYSGDSLLLDGFTRGQEVAVNLSFVNHRNEESASLEYSFETLDSAPWAFFDDLEVSSSWNGFQVIYKSPTVVTGMAHIFYLGINPVTQKEDTILVNSFPLLQGGDTLNFILQQENLKNTVIVRTEDFKGYRVRQEIFPDVDAFRSEKWPMTAADFNDFGISIEDVKAKTGVQYLFDGELRGEERFIASTAVTDTRSGTEVCATYVAGPYAFGKPIILDLREQKTPAWVRMYCFCPMTARFTAANQALSNVWKGSYEDKLPCNVTVYGNKESSDPNADGWEYLGRLAQDPSAEVQREWWAYRTTQLESAPSDVNELAKQDPIYVDIQLPPHNKTYRYLKLVVNDTFDTRKSNVNTNEQDHFTLHELEVYVKKN